MEYVIEFFDNLMLDDFYAKTAPTWDREYWLRQYLTISVVWWLGGTISYFLISGLSYHYLFDKASRKDKRFLKEQEKKEITLSCISIPIMAVPSSFIFLAEVKGYSLLYEGVNGVSGWLYLLATIPVYLFFTDMMIYWIHRWIHHPVLYPYIHKPHHRWIVPTPFASYAFHPLDGFLQSLPYHIFTFCVPLHKFLYLGLFIFVCMWTVSIHDGKGFYMGTIINGSDHHTIHHSDFYYNYGQYFTLWDKIGGTHRDPNYHEIKKAEKAEKAFKTSMSNQSNLKSN